MSELRRELTSAFCDDKAMEAEETPALPLRTAEPETNDDAGWKEPYDVVVWPLESVVAKACATRAAVERDPSDSVSTVEEDAVKKPNTAARGVELVDADRSADEAVLAVFDDEELALLRWKVVNEV